ncbi:MAG: hypothetical protein ACKPKO_28075, partial [Candidatus Fonsibacter sp.]
SAEFDYYAHLGSVRQPIVEDKGTTPSETDLSVDEQLDDLLAAAILQRYGIDSNIMFDSSGENPSALLVRSKKRDWSYTECIDVCEWLIYTGCGHDLLSKHEVAPYKDFVQQAKSPVVFRIAN